MNPRTVDLVIAVGFLLIGLVPLAWAGAGPALVRLLVPIAAVVGTAMASRA